MTALSEQLSSLTTDVATVWRARGLGDEWLIEQARTLDRAIRVTGVVEVGPEPLTPDASHHELGEQLMAEGRVAFCVLAGGMATRMGGVVKALVPVRADGMTFLDVRRREQALLAARFGVSMPLWLMTSEATHEPIAKALGDAAHAQPFRQHVSLRLEDNGALFFAGDGRPSLHATGHGDLPDALRASGLLAEFVARGGRYVWIANLDNLGATPDPSLLGFFAAQQKPLGVEVCDKITGDKGGIPVRVDGRAQVLEEQRLPSTFDAASVRVFNTNSMIVDAQRLLDLQMQWTWIVVKKQVEGRTALQLERLIGELTSTLDTAYLRVPRSGPTSRFMPVKDHAELAARRAEIEQALAARGILPA